VELDEVRSALAVAAHPDDIESWCAGTLAALMARGARVAFLLLTSGDKGSADPLAVPAQIAATREAEQLAAAEILGVRDVVFLRRGDGTLADSPALRKAIAGEIRRVRPDLLFAFDPWEPYAFHCDHRESALAALAAAYPLARRPGPDGAAPHAVRAAWLFHTSRPDRFVDITATFEARVAARAAHASQTRDPAALDRTWRERAAATGAPAGLALAEAFHEVVFPPPGADWEG
jgi:LmbE family N-acetylglucosaminyl deacetylase